MSVIMFGCRGHREIGYPMSKEIVSNVSYPVAAGTTVLLSIDCQFGFGAASWEQVPHADAAAEPYPDLIADGDLVVYKTTFSAVLSSDLVQDTDAFVAQVRALQPAAG